MYYVAIGLDPVRAMEFSRKPRVIEERKPK